MSVSEETKKSNRFLPDARRVNRLINWAIDQEERFRLDWMSDETLETLLRNLGPFYHGVECLEADGYPTVEQFRSVLADFHRVTVTEPKKIHYPHLVNRDDADGYNDAKLEELILWLEPLFHLDLEDEKIYKGLINTYIEDLVCNPQYEDE